MALEEAGIQLKTAGFRTYISNLEKIEKSQKQTFSTQPKGLERSFDRAEKSARDYERQIKKTEKAQIGFSKAIGGLALGGIAALGTRELLRFGKESIDLARIQAKAEAQLAAAIKSTGGAAGLSSRELKNLASALQETTLFGDETTIAAESLLLTFTKIGRDVFPDAIRLSQDLATAMDKDLSSAALQVGKALNDPVRGLASLREASIQFTPEQEALVKHLVEINDLAGAQGIILAELSRQFGGSAEAAREADGGITPLANSFGDLKEQIGSVLSELNQASGFTEGLTSRFGQLAGEIRGLRARAGVGDLSDEIAGVDTELQQLILSRDQLLNQEGLIGKIFDFLPGSEERIRLHNEEIAELEQQLRGLNQQAAAEDAEELANAQENAATATGNLNEELEEETKQFTQLANAVRQAERIQLQQARAQQDAARSLERQQTKLQKDQFKERDKFLNDQGQAFEDFNASQFSDIKAAEAALSNARVSAGRGRIRDQERLQRQLRQAQDRFNLTQAQSERRFQLSDRRLRAEGDILALQELRENNTLDVRENQENFDLQKGQRKEDGKEAEKDRDRQRREQVQALEAELKDLQSSLAERQNAFLAAQDTEFRELLRGQQEARDALLLAERERQEDRAIAFNRQLEDLGRSLADQEDLTETGAKAIADELEKVFGVEGVADNIFQGFSDRTESEFRELFKKVEAITRSIPLGLGRGRGSSPRGTGGSLERPLQFQEGGIVPGPIGAPQAAIVHGGEGVFTAREMQSHTMAAPVIQRQSMDVTFGGRSQIDVSGLSGASQDIVNEAVTEMVRVQEIAIQRIIRRG